MLSKSPLFFHARIHIHQGKTLALRAVDIFVILLFLVLVAGNQSLLSTLFQLRYQGSEVGHDWRYRCKIVISPQLLFLFSVLHILIAAH